MYRDISIILYKENHIHIINKEKLLKNNYMNIMNKFIFTLL